MAAKEDRPIPLPIYTHGVTGLIHRKEASFLYNTPARIGDGLYCDLGTLYGRSSLCMAGGMLDNDVKGHIITVDAYIKYMGTRARFQKTLRTKETVRKTFEEKGLDSYVTVVEGLTAETAADYQDKEFVFVFIDADHTYEGCKADFEAWSPLVRSGGEIAFHDSGHEAVNRVIEESGWEVIHAVHTIKVIKKP